MAPCHRIESERGSAVSTAIGDRVCAGYLFSASAQQPASARKQGGDAHREAVKSLAITVNAAGVGQAFPIIDIGAAVVGALVIVGRRPPIIIARQRRISRKRRGACPRRNVGDIGVCRREQDLGVIAIEGTNVSLLIGVWRAIRNGGSEFVMRPWQSGGQ